MPVIGFLVFLIVVFFAFAFYCVIATPIWIVISDRLWPRMTDRRRAAIGLAVVPMSFMVCALALNAWVHRPSAVFELAFGFPPSPDVNITSATHYIFGDSGEQTLTFSADPETIDRILKMRFNTTLSDSATNKDGNYEFSREFSESFYSETAELEYNPNRLAANYSWKGID